LGAALLATQYRKNAFFRLENDVPQTPALREVAPRFEILRPVVSVLKQISEHVYWMPPAPPDRPSLCAVVGARRTLMLDGGSSAAHANLFTDQLFSSTGTRPSAVVYTHSHWDHVLGGASLGGFVIAHTLTAEQLQKMAETDWSDEGLDYRVAVGLASPQHAMNVKAELPSPRRAEVSPADVVFDERIDVDLGGVTIHVRHLGGDHSADSSVVDVHPDRVLFLGDCLSASPEGVLTATSAFRLRDAVLAFQADAFVEGHHESVSSRAEMEALFEKIRRCEAAAREGLDIDESDDDAAYFFRAFKEGHQRTK
jgi:glyoxylase-like metal-dependent hydrolase (beta-lactamase superfamily II)